MNDPEDFRNTGAGCISVIIVLASLYIAFALIRGSFV